MANPGRTKKRDVLEGLPAEFVVNPELRGLAEQVKRDIIRTASKTSFNDVVGLQDAKRLLTEAVWLPQTMPEIFQMGRVISKICTRVFCSLYQDCPTSLVSPT